MYRLQFSLFFAIFNIKYYFCKGFYSIGFYVKVFNFFFGHLRRETWVSSFIYIIIKARLLPRFFIQIFVLNARKRKIIHLYHLSILIA